MTFILSVSIVIILWRVGRLEDQLLEEKYELRDLRKRMWEMELRDIEETWQKSTNHHDTQED